MIEYYEYQRFKYYGNEKSELEAFLEYVYIKPTGIYKFYKYSDIIFVYDINNKCYINNLCVDKSIFIRKIKDLIRYEKLDKIINICLLKK